MPRLSAAVRIRTRRIWLAALFALGLEIAIGVFVWHLSQWRLLSLVAIFLTLLVTLLIGVVLAGERWKNVGDFRVRHPTISTALVIGIPTATVVGFVIGPVGIVIGPLVLGVAFLVGWAAQKAREFIGM